MLFFNVLPQFTLRKSVKTQGHRDISVLREQQNAILRERVCPLPNVKTILNTGSFPEAQDKEGRKYRDYFGGRDFFTIDANRNLDDPHHFAMDLHDLSGLKKRFDLIVCMSVLEHVKNPFLVARQLESILEKEGFLYLSVPFFFPLHKSPQNGFSDYWRFTDDGLRELFNPLKEIWIQPIASVITSVRDRPKHWKAENAVSGYCALFQKKI